ncbi:MAG: GAF domain-containing protein [Geobacteraceae bacterium]|nr:GAF domain-containing protein [Geobacteraceae bacterium]
MKSRYAARIYPVPFFLIFLTLVLAIIGIGFRYYLIQKDKITGEKLQELSAIAGLKTEEIAKWREERLADAKSLQSNRHFVRHVALFLKRPDDRDIREQLLEWLSSFQTSFLYRSAALLDANSVQRLIAGDQSVATGVVSRGLALTAMHTGDIQISDLHASETFHTIHLDILVPLFLSHEKGQNPVGVLQLVIDPSKRFYPLILSWPTLSLSAEALLVRKEGSQVVFLNQLRHRKGAALSLRFPHSAKNLSAAMVARGFVGVTQGIDYRGIPVLAAVKKVYGSPWFLVAKVDAKEILKPVRDQALVAGLFVLFLILLAAMTIALFWRHGCARIYKRLYEEERRYHALADRIENLTRCAYDTILLFDEHLQVIEANEKAMEMYGYSRDELLELTLEDVLSPDEIVGIEERSREITQNRGAVFKSVHRRKDGTFFPVECSVSYLELEDAAFYQVIVRDVSEWMAAEGRIERLNRMYATLSQANQAIVHGPDRQAILEEICRVICEQGGLRMAWIGLVDRESRQIRSVAHSGYEESYLERLEISVEDVPAGRGLSGRAVREGHSVVCQDACTDPKVEPWRDLALSQGYHSGVSCPIMLKGEAVGVLSSYSSEPYYFDAEIVVLFEELSQDVSFALESFAQTEELRRSEKRYRLLFDHMINGFAVHELVFNADGKPVDYRFLEVNPAYEQITGISREQAVGVLASKVYPLGVAPFLDIYADVALNGTTEVFDASYPVVDKYFSISVFCPDKDQFATVFTDCTDMRIAEEERMYNEARLQSLYNISQYRAANVQDLLDYSLLEALRLTSSKFGYIYFYDEDTREFTLNSWSNEVMKECAVVEPQTKYDLDKTGIWGEVVRQRRPILANDFQGCNPLKKGYPPGHVELLSYLTIPVFSGERITAVIGVANKSGVYDETDVRQLTLLSDSVWKYVERKNTEEELISLNLMLEQRINERTADLESFTYSVSHDLRTPLRAIIGFSRILLDDYAGVLDSEGQRLLNVVIDQTKRMGQLIDDLLAFSRAGRAAINYSHINMTDLAREVLDQLVTDEMRERLELRLGTLPEAKGDGSLLRQVWTNLLSNAVKFTLPRGVGVIEVGAKLSEDEDVYYVKDTGIGFDMQYADKLFDIFHRLHSAGEFDGNGVGLAIVHRIIICHGGRVWAEGRQGEGATFYFSLPRKGLAS